MLTLADINNIEYEDEIDPVDYYQSIQRAINAKSWSFQGSEIVELPEDCVGFVYLITNNLTGRKYIGKKLAKFSKTTYRVHKLKNGTKKKKKIRSRSFCFIGSRTKRLTGKNTQGTNSTSQIAIN